MENMTLVVMMAFAVLLGMSGYMAIAFAVMNIRTIRRWVAKLSLNMAQDVQEIYLEDDEDEES